MGLLPQSDTAPGIAPQPCGPDGRCGALAAALERAQAENRRLETAYRAASEFLARMSHELRTPFNAIIGFAEMMGREIYGPLGHERYAEYARHIADSANHLLGLMSDILDASRLEHGSLCLDEAPLEIEPLLSSSATMVRPRAGQSLVGIDLEVEPALRLLGDERRVKQTVVNILVNAVKFSHPGGRVRLAGYRDFDGSVVVEVCDSGIGIPEDDLERITLPFVQAGRPGRRPQDGAGLGLTLAKAFMELHQGSLKIDSILGRGTTVTLRFPPERTLTAG